MIGKNKKLFCGGDVFFYLAPMPMGAESCKIVFPPLRRKCDCGQNIIPLSQKKVDSYSYSKTWIALLNQVAFIGRNAVQSQT